MIFQSGRHLLHLVNDEGTGSGLGLAISRKIMDLLHGTIGVKSTYGDGCIFKVTLPLA